jgi:Glycosyl transferase family 8
MKWYFAINETATATPLAEHAKLAVRSARRVTDLRPHLLYFGKRNGFTAWMEAQHVTVIDAQPSFLSDLYRATEAGWYSRDLTGHWLRTEVCNIEVEDRFVLYTDIDVVFLKPISVEHLVPKFFACAPEFREDDWSYFNSGVMLMNVPSLRADYPNLRQFIQDKFASPRSGLFNDQHVYNDFYRDVWSPLDPIYNWKPYWRPNEQAAILHLHGPKIHDICKIIDHRWDWDTEIGRQVGDIFVTHFGEYIHHLQTILSIVQPEGKLYGSIERILRHAPAIVNRMIAEREGRIEQTDDRIVPVAAHEGIRTLAALRCPSCGLSARITDTFLWESHLSHDFGYVLHPDDLVSFTERCRYQSAGEASGEVVPFCVQLIDQALARIFPAST